MKVFIYRLTEDYNTRYKLKDFKVDSIIEDITVYPEKVINFKNYLMNLRTPRLSRKLVNFLIYKSKMKNYKSKIKTHKSKIIINFVMKFNYKQIFSTHN